MFGFLSSRRRRAQLPKRYRRIQFESLERRYCLSAPSITAFQIDSIDGSTVSVSGYVADENPESVYVELYDSLYGIAYPDATGYFSYSGEASYPGTITAAAYDQEYGQSAPAQVVFSDEPEDIVNDEPEDIVSDEPEDIVNDEPEDIVNDEPEDIANDEPEDIMNDEPVDIVSDMPVISSLTVAYGYHADVAIVGEVTAEDPAGLNVYFSGAVNGSTVTDANGGFMIEVVDGSATLGEVQVTVSDAYGQGAYEYVTITGDDAPEIINFTTHIDGGGLMTIEGTVTDEDAVGLRVVFNFWQDVFEVTTDSNGDFIWQLQLEEGQEGWLSAVAYDWWNLASGTAEAYVGYDLGSY